MFDGDDHGLDKATARTNIQSVLHPYAFSASTMSSLLALFLMLRIHTNAKAHDTGDANTAYPPYLIKSDSE